jgi:hypothetical protein
VATIRCGVFGSNASDRDCSCWVRKWPAKTMVDSNIFIRVHGQLSEIAAELDVAAQLAGLAKDLKTLAARPIEPMPTLAEPGDQP